MVYHVGEAQPHVPELPAKSNMDNNIAILDKQKKPHSSTCKSHENSRH